MARELMAITGLPAQELVHIARAAFGAVGGRASAAASAERAVAMRIFCNDGVTGDGWGLCLIGNQPLCVQQCVVD